ncbi:hypothetical protein AMTRI_Chr06g171160 [Amborella trichopoda]
MKWKPPLEVWLKLNFEGSVCPEIQKASYGGILKDSHRSVIFIYSGQLDFCGIHEDELMVVKGVLNLQEDHVHVIIEGDSGNVINWYPHPRLVPWRLTSVMDEILFYTK